MKSDAPRSTSIVLRLLCNKTPESFEINTATPKMSWGKSGR